MEKRTENYETSGIDISNHQSDLTISDIASGVDFIILRSSYTGYGGTGETKYKDASFERFYSECKALNIPIGAYHYSCARTYEQGQSEAQYMYENCLYGKQMELPVYLDVENDTWQTSDKDGVTKAIIGFRDYMLSVGWYGCVYANRNYFTNYIDLTQITDINKWLAHYTSTKPTYMDYEVWQYSESIYISGYSGKLDGDKMYFDYPTFIKNNGYNGYTSPTPYYHSKGNFPFYIVKRKKSASVNDLLFNNKGKII